MGNSKRLQLILLTIRNKREKLKYPQFYMAYKMGVGQNCYSKLELGRTELTVARLLDICDLLEIDMRYILDPR